MIVASAGRHVALCVIVPTIGRPELLTASLGSIIACDPGPAEIIVVDQSDGTATDEVVRNCGDVRVRRVACDGRGAARARNAGLRAASHDIVMFTDDDCRVALDWVALGFAHLSAMSDGIVTGRVLPGERGVGVVPSTMTLEQSREWTGVQTRGVLYTGNMAGSRNALLNCGAFDERPSLRFAAEDNDLCFRWIRSGGKLRYEPDLVVWHEDWRSSEQMTAVFVRYARGQGAFYAKHLLRGDKVIARFFVQDLRRGFRARTAWTLGHRDADQDEAIQLVPWMLVGLAHGFVDSVLVALRRLARRQ